MKISHFKTLYLFMKNEIITLLFFYSELQINIEIEIICAVIYLVVQQ